MLLPTLLSEISSHDLEVAETLISVLRFILIFVAARTLAEVLVRFELPTILGELLAGVVIGASGLHLLVPPETQVQLSGVFTDAMAGMAHISGDEVTAVYDESFGALRSVSNLGLYSLLFLTGLESELEELMAVGVQAFSVAVVGVVLPFAFGTLGLMAIFHVDPIPAIFAGASMTATSIGITASVFGELGYLRTREGQIVIGAAVLDDILGIVILAIVVSLGAGGSLAIAPIVKLVVAAVLFVVVALVLSRKAAPAFDWVMTSSRHLGQVGRGLSTAGCTCFAATAIGLEAALGAFAAGLIASTSRHRDEIQAAVMPIVGLFATVFFVLVGAGMDLSVINPSDPAARSALIVAGFLFIVAIIGKVAAGWAVFSKEKTNHLVVGLGMMPRGEVGLIFLGLGTASGLLNPGLEAAILLMVIGTTFLAPVLLRLVLKGKPPEDGNEVPEEYAADPMAGAS